MLAILTFSVSLLLTFPVSAEFFQDKLDDLGGDFKIKMPSSKTLDEEKKQGGTSFSDLVKKMKENQKNRKPLFK